MDLQQRSKRLFASGLRNPNGMAWEPTTGALWTVVNDYALGTHVAPLGLTAVQGSRLAAPFAEGMVIGVGSTVWRINP